MEPTALTGVFTGSITFGPGEANETTLTAPASEMLLARFDSTGDLAWVRQAGSVTAFVDGTAVALDVSGNPYVTGTFSGTAVVFGSGQLNRGGGYRTECRQSLDVQLRVAAGGQLESAAYVKKPA